MMIFCMLLITRWPGFPSNSNNPSPHTARMTEGQLYYVHISSVANTAFQFPQKIQIQVGSRNHHFQTSLVMTMSTRNVGPTQSPTPSKVPPRRNRLWDAPNFLSSLETTTSKPAVGSQNLLFSAHL